MSHELRTPLNAVIGYSELLEEEALVDPEGLDDLGRIRLSARNLLGLVDQILDLSRVASGQVDLHLEEVDLHELVAGVIETVGPAAERRNNVLVEQVSAERRVLLDRGRVRQVLLNLVSNAVKFTEGGTVRVEVEQEEGWVCLRVRDTGVGIDPEQVPYLFQPFEQATKQIAYTHGGTGLGLALCDRLVRRMGGQIDLETQLGEGCTFTVELPSRSCAVVSLSAAS